MSEAQRILDCYGDDQLALRGVSLQLAQTATDIGHSTQRFHFQDGSFIDIPKRTSLSRSCIWPDCGHDTNRSGQYHGCNGIGCPREVQ